ncbi:DUF551 domain-containing protein [Escherichia coli]|nr:DUF551 domain-containing protein [Escherichia coli]
MTTFTDKELIKEIKERIGSLDVRDNIERRAYEIALASLEAEPVAWKATFTQIDHEYNTFTAMYSDKAEAERWVRLHKVGDFRADITPLYTAKPVPVVPGEIADDLMEKLPKSDAWANGVRGCWNSCRAVMLQSGNFREIAETSTNSPVIPSEVLSAILKFARVRADFDDFDGDRRGIGDCLDETEHELIVTINKYASQLAAEPIATNDVREQQTAVPPIQADVAQAIENLKQKLVECNRYNYCADAVKGVEDACHAAMRQGSQPVSQTYNLPELIEGMEVSIDVSTCDADLGNRYFGTVTEALELDTAKNGYILLVQDAEPNFDVNGNSPGTPDSWISCSDRMPEKGQNVLISVNFDSSLVEPLICSARYTGSTFRRGDATIKPGNGIEQATHWIPLPEPPQEVNRG